MKSIKNILTGVYDLTLGKAKRKATHIVAKRLWMEGSCLTLGGFSKGVRYDLNIDAENGVLEILINENGKRVVSGKGDDLPIIDIVRQDLASTFGEDTQRVRVKVFKGYIKVTVHPSEYAIKERTERFSKKIDGGKAYTLIMYAILFLACFFFNSAGSN